MEKANFKSGMILHFENEDKGLLLDNEIFLFRHVSKNFSGSISLSNYNEQTKKINSYKLIKVSQPITPKATNIGIDLNNFMNARPYQNLVWKEYQKKTEELTLDQICKELGREIKIIKG